MLSFSYGVMNESTRDASSVSSSGGRSQSAVGRAPDRETSWRACVRRIAARDQSGLTALYDESSPIVYGLAYRVLSSAEDAEEVTIDVYNQVWRTAESYQEGRGSVLSWLATMARTRAIDRLRSRSVVGRSDEPLSAVLEHAEAGVNVEDTIVQRLDSRRISAALDSLPEEQQRALRLAYFTGMTHSEIAAHLGVPIGTVKTRIRLGLMRLRDVLEG